MAIIKCKMCGGDLVIEPGSTVAECEYCGSRQTVPTADNEKKMVQFERAERLRKNCEFDKAAGIYESIVSEFRTESEAYWGLFLCKYGIEYVDDPATGKKIPTCHRSSFDSVMEDSDFEQALENADTVARKVYREEAKQIEEIRKGIIAVSANEAPYDIFICYKETDENGQRTIDSAIAQDIYDALTAKDYRVFFSRITLEDKLGQEYEPYIFAALNSAKIMLAFGTDYEYFNAVWVKNEWGRYLKLMASDKSKHLIPCYKNIDAYDMPREFAKLQAQDMGKVGAIQDLLRGIAKLMPKQEQETAAVTAAVPGAGAMVMRGQFALDDGDFQKAAEFFERALDQNPQDGSAYLGKVLAALHVSSAQQLEDYYLQIRDDKDFDRAIRFSDAAASDSLQKILDQSHRKYLLKCVVTGICKYARMREKAEKLEAQQIALEKQRELERIEQERREEEERIARKKREEEERIAREKREEEERIARKKREDEAKKRAEEEERIVRQQQKENSLRLKPIRERVQKASGLLSSNEFHLAAVKSDGRVVTYGYTDNNQELANACTIVRAKHIVAVSAQRDFIVALTEDGSVIATRSSGYGMENSTLREVGNWQNIVAISSSPKHIVGLTADGRVKAAGSNEYGQCNVNHWQDIVAVSAGGSHTVGLKSDGTVVAVGKGQWTVTDWQDIVAVSAGVGLTADGRIWGASHESDVGKWQDIVAISAGEAGTVGVCADGTLRTAGWIPYEVSTWRNVVAVSAEYGNATALTADGRVLSTYGENVVNKWKLFENLDTIEQERWRAASRCQHCGGAFKGLFKKTCASCGKPKDY